MCEDIQTNTFTWNSSHIHFLSYERPTIILAIQISHEYGLDIIIALIEPEYGGGADDYKIKYMRLK